MGLVLSIGFSYAMGMGEKRLWCAYEKKNKDKT